MPRPRKVSMGSPTQPNGTDVYAPNHRVKRHDPLAMYSLESEIPTAVRFPLLVILSSSLSLFLLQLFSQYYSGGEMGAISKTVSSWPEVGAVIFWRVVEVAFVWFMEFDAWDTAYFTILTHSPPLSLLNTFYNIRPTVAIGHLVIDILAIALPLRLLRPNVPVHKSHLPKSVSNRAILTDPSTTISCAILATVVYALSLYAAYSTFLPVYMINYFEDLVTMENVHMGAAGLPRIILSCLPIGWAAKEFIFVSSTSASKGPTRSTRSDPNYFDPADATLTETIYHNAWGGYTARQKVLIARTASVMLMMSLHTSVELLGKMKGVSFQGASGWCAMWEFATLTVTAAYWWVGAVDGV